LSGILARHGTAVKHHVILLKLYAGGPQDAWDIEQLLGGPDRRH
jgi:hypothetical protein